jgi:DNA repair protein RadC
MKNIKLTDGPRERCLSQGVSALADHELLMLLLGSGYAQADVRSIALKITQSTQWKSELATFNQPFLLNQPGIGPAKVCTLLAAAELGRRLYACEQSKRTTLKVTCAVDVFQWIRPRVIGLAQEVCWLLLLTPQNKILDCSIIAQGNEMQAVVDIKKILRQVLTANTRRFIMVHNHPSGDAVASTQDIAWTRKLLNACALMDLQCLDHIVVTAKQYHSIKEQQPCLWSIDMAN